MAQPIETLFRLTIQVGPGNHVLDGGPDPGQFWARGKHHSIVQYRDTLWSSVHKNSWADQDAVWVVGSDGPNFAQGIVLDRAQIPHGKW